MKYRRFAPLQRELSQLVLGSMLFTPETVELSYAMLDAWRALGGNVVDTAHLYNSGHSERILGDWLRDRGCRDEIVILTKGAHHNADRRRVTPEDITCDLRDSLARLKTDYVDLYLLHRDDPAVPVGPIVEVLNEHWRAGRIRAFGGSNWSPERLDAANAYAAERGLQGMTASSPHLSLAAPREEIWPGCLDARDARSVAWYRERQMPLFAWSSQARGFFRMADEGGPEGAGPPAAARGLSPEQIELLRRVYDTLENRERRRRAEALGRRRGFTATQVALAWVLHQPFPVYALIGPQTLEELHACVRALELALSPEEVAWLDLRD